MTRYSAIADEIADGTFQLRFVDRTAGDHSLTWQGVLGAWETDDAFCEAFSGALTNAPMAACFWETPPLSRDTVDTAFECVLKIAPMLARQRADPNPFAAQFRAAADGQVIVFGNLGGDADLVVPRDRIAGADYAHLASFLRSAPADQVRALWRHVALAARPWLEQGRKCWISTSGLGVSWLHVRVDARPKYYSHAPYRTM
jgi:hypothetical protein